MNWRKLNRILHRDLGYFFFGMTIIYAVSGIVLNHRTPSGDPSIVTRSFDFAVRPVEKEQVNRDYILHLMEKVGKDEYRNYYFPSSNSLMIYFANGHVSLDMQTGKGKFISVKKRPVLTEFNFLHYNKPRQLWTVFSDVFAVSLAIMAITGLFILRGKKGIRRRGAILAGIGVTIPLLFLVCYFWTNPL